MGDSKRENTFRFKRFTLSNNRSAMKVGTDGVILGAWADIPGGSPRVADIGCGTGLIALMIAQREPSATVTAIEIDPVAADEALENAQASPFSERVDVINADATTHLFTHTGHYSLLVTNPPFFIEDVKPDAFTRCCARHEGDLTLDAIFALAATLLAPSGEIALILPSSRDGEAVYQGAIHGFNPRRQCHISTVEGHAPKRTLWQFSRYPAETSTSTLTIRERSGKFSTPYIDLVSDFYINL